jgi:argininosuccinate lyase
MREMLATATFDTERLAAAAERGFSTATEVADYLVRQGLPFREAHSVVGQIVRYCEKQSVTLADLSLTEWQSFSQEFREDILPIISATGAVHAKRSPGGTAPERVQEQITKARELLAG